MPCYKHCKQMEYKASQELLLDSEDPEVSFWIVPLYDNLTFVPFHISSKGGWVDTHHFAEEGGELAQVDLLWISSLFIFWNLVFVTVVHLPGCRRSEGDGVGGEACTGRGGGE